MNAVTLDRDDLVTIRYALLIASMACRHEREPALAERMNRLAAAIKAMTDHHQQRKETVR